MTTATKDSLIAIADKVSELCRCINEISAVETDSCNTWRVEYLALAENSLKKAAKNIRYAAD